MDCWIASFPRSGNTYFRNILYYVYGIESSTWHRETAYPVDENYDKYRFVKTHLLPEDIIPTDPSIPAIYLVRDGRDAVVSIAHHRKDLVVPGSDFNKNLEEAIVAAGGSFFGGWSMNVSAWLLRAQLVVRYEDLIADPVATFRRVEKLIKLPPPQWDKLPAFDAMKSGKPKYGGTSRLANPQFNPDEFAEKFFRKGKAGGWREDMSPFYRDLFWNYHGDVMERMGYDSRKGSVGQNESLDYKAMQLMGREMSRQPGQKIKIYLEASKLAQSTNDGIKRYLFHLLKRFTDLKKYGDPRWEFTLLIGRRFYPLSSYDQVFSTEEVETLHPYEKVLMGIKSMTRFLLPGKFYQAISALYKKTDARRLLRKVQLNTSIKKRKAFYSKLVSQIGSADLLHIPLPQNVGNYKSLDYTFLVTVHDLTHKLFPEYHEKENIARTEAGMEFIVEKQVDVIAVSKNTISDLEANYSLPAEKIHLAYESPDQEIFRHNVNKEIADGMRQKYKLGPAKYFLCLSTIEPRKNLPNTIRAFNRFTAENPAAEINLVVSGNFGWKTEHLSEELHLDNPKIIFTGYVEDADLPIVYSEALALCYLSFYEGFGLPPLEAMSCRTPVIYGNNSSLKEVVGDAGLPADSGDIGSILAQMKRLACENGLRDELAARAHQRSFEFSWRRTVFDTLNAYEETAGKHAKK